MENNESKTEKNKVIDSIDKSVKTHELMTAALCLFVAGCYGIYVIQSFWTALSFSGKYGQYINQLNAFASLYLFGKFGLIVDTAIEVVILFKYKKSRMINRQEFLYFLMFVVLSNLLAYAIVSYIYEFALTFIR